MLPGLLNAQQALDCTVEAAYVPGCGKRKWASDGERVAFLFHRHCEPASMLPGR
jgi:hypothetical protein